MCLGRRGPSWCCSALVISTEREPQDVFGAGTLVHQQTAMQTAHVARGGRRLA
jgi:hypothetical protein